MTVPTPSVLERVRLDKWLWAARFYKTRQLAQDAIVAGHITVNGERAKPARLLRTGDRLTLRLNGVEYHPVVIELAERRAAAVIARTWYSEASEHLAAREIRQLELKAQAVNFPHGEGRPTKKARRQIIRFTQE